MYECHTKMQKKKIIIFVKIIYKYKYKTYLLNKNCYKDGLEPNKCSLNTQSTSGLIQVLSIHPFQSIGPLGRCFL